MGTVSCSKVKITKIVSDENDDEVGKCGSCSNAGYHEL